MGIKIFGGQKLKAFLNANAKSSTKDVEVGFFEGNEYENGTPVAAVAFYNEFGTRTKNGGVHIPERPFFRNANTELKGKLVPLVKAKMERVNGALMVTDKTLGIVGTYHQGLIQRSIERTLDPPNAPSTIKQKGSDHPLIDTGYMLRSVTYKVGEA